uniref:Uncharacterized protein n=1 Tax=Ditylenchus dipsaci TaxID=166011 RepID=A0A915DF93_9BILA
MFLSCDILFEVLCFDSYESCSRHLLTSKLFSVAVFERVELQRNRLKETVKDVTQKMNEMEVEAEARLIELNETKKKNAELLRIVTEIDEKDLPAALRKFRN